MEDEAILMKAMADLRKHLGMSQQSFSVYIGKSYASAQRYEQLKPPPMVELPRYVRMAREAGRPDIAGVFKRAAIGSVPAEIVELIREPEIDGESAKANEDGPRDKRRVRA